MRVVLQRVRRAEVRVEGHPPARIDRGYLLLVGLAVGDELDEVLWMAKKVASLRLFPDAAGKMNCGLEEVAGRCLAVSQFTLLGDARKGRRPDFFQALAPALARPLFDRFCIELESLTGPVARGVFGAHMEVELINDGPVTLLLERRPDDRRSGSSSDPAG